MLTPEGLSAHKIDKIMLLAMWTNYVQKERAHHLLDTPEVPVVIFAGMGKPTYPLNTHTRQFFADYWGRHSGAAIDYGHPQGDVDARQIMAKAMTHWYETDIDESNILFTVGGAGSLKSIFSALKTLHNDESNFRVITPFPYYTLIC